MDLAVEARGVVFVVRQRECGCVGWFSWLGSCIRRRTDMPLGIMVERSDFDFLQAEQGGEMMREQECTQ